LDEASSPAKAREQSPQAGQYCPVGRLQPRTVDLASEYRHLVAQDDDLNCKVAVLAEGEADQLEDANERPVQERESHRGMLAASGDGRQHPAHSPWMAFLAPQVLVTTGQLAECCFEALVQSRPERLSAHGVL
jgi:hypothetical protein